MGTNGYAVFAREAYGFVHGGDAPSVYSTCDIRRGDAPHQSGILPALLTQVGVEVDSRYCFDVGHACNSCHIPGSASRADSALFKGNCSARPLPYGWVVGLWFTAGRRKCWGEPGRLPGRGRLRAPHPVPLPAFDYV